MSKGNYEIVWEEPPAELPTGVARALVTALEQLKTKPNQWARIGAWSGESMAYQAQRLLKQEPRPSWMPAGNYEYKIVREPIDSYTPKGRQRSTSKLYARYLSKSAE